MCVSKILPRRPFVLHFLWKGVYLPAILTTEKCAFRISDSVPFLRAYHKQHCTATWALSLGFLAQTVAAKSDRGSDGAWDRATSATQNGSDVAWGRRGELFPDRTAGCFSYERQMESGCLTGRVEARNDSLPSCEGMMCGNLSCQNDRHISLYGNQKRELEVTESAGMGPFLKKVAAAFPGRNFQKRIWRSVSEKFDWLIDFYDYFGNPVVFKHAATCSGFRSGIRHCFFFCYLCYYRCFVNLIYDYGGCESGSNEAPTQKYLETPSSQFRVV